MSIAYKSKVNERVTGSPISLEPHTVGIVGVFTVVPNVIRLVEVPQGPGSAVSIYGYTETLTPSPSGTQFYVDYPTGVITFNASQNGHSVLVSYTGLGSEIAAEDINELQIPVGIALNADGSLSAGIVTTTSLSGSLVLPFTTLQTLNNSIVPVTNGSGYLISSATTATELGYLSGAASNIQAQLNALSSGTITSVVGTTHEIIASTSFGVVTLSTPQAIDTTSSPTFYSLTLTNPLTVGNGGTGDSSHTAYAVLTGGTTSTGALQSVSGVGTSGQVLTSNGASTLPTWQTLITPSGITALTGDVTTSVSPSNPYLNTASTYAVLGETAVTNTGSTVLIGDLGISPNNATSITGFPPGTYSGTENAGNSAAATALADATSAAATLTAMGPGTDLSSTDLGGHTCVPGVYHTSSTATWSAGNLTLNGAGTYIFLIGSSLTMPANATVVLEGGAIADNVYFVTVSTFTFGANCTVNGTILAGTSITFASNSVLNGRALCYGPSGTTVAFPSAATVTVPPGSGGVEVATLATVNSDVGSFTWTNFTVNAKGLITAASTNPTPVTSIYADSNPLLTGSVQLVSGTNVTLSQVGQVITINATSGGSGTVNSGTVHQLAYYSATGTAVSGSSILSQDVNGLIITSPAPYVRSAAGLDILAAANLYLTAGGTIFLYGNVIDAATHKIINLGNGSAAQDAAAFGQITAANAGALALSGGTLIGSLGIGESPVASAVLDVASTTQGFLPPRMTTTQMNAISSPAEGLEIYATDTHQWMGYNGSAWVILG